jgi:hypothetical protein
MGCCDGIVELGAPGANGNDGVSSYTYIAYADDVTLGTPDVVTGFNADTPLPTSEWIAIITSSTPLTPVEADFDGYWVKIKGADGSGSAGINIKVNNTTVTGGPFTTLDFLGSGLSGIAGADAGSGEVDITVVTAGLITITRANALSLIGSSGLTPGASYWVYDVGDGDIGSAHAGVILRAIRNNAFDNVGIFIAKTPNRSAVSQWSEITSYSSGTYVEDFNEVYNATTATTIGNPPCATPAEWTFVVKSNATYYRTEIHGCVYNITDDQFYKRWDQRGNSIELTGVPSGTTANEILLQCFRWGTDNVVGNKITLDCQTVSGGWAVGRLPNDLFFIPCYSSGQFKNNVVTLSPSYGSITVPISTYFDLVNNTFNDNTVFNSQVVLYDNGNTQRSKIEHCVTFNSECIVTASDIIKTNISGNDADVSITNSTIKNSTIIDNINATSITTSDIDSSTIDGNDSCVFSSLFGNFHITNNIDLDIYNSTGINNRTGLNIFSNNQDLLVQDLVGRFFNIDSNESIILQYLNVFNGTINLNINNVPANKNQCRLQQLTLDNDASITSNAWNTQGIILRGRLSGNRGTIRNVLFDNTVSRTIGNVETAAKTVQQGDAPSSFFVLDQFAFDDSGIDGNNTTRPFETFPSAASFPTISSTGTYDYINMSPAANNAYAFLDMSDVAIFNAGALTLPVWAEHAGIFYLYNGTGQIITSIAYSSGIYSTYRGPYKFIKLEDGGSVVFRPIAIATPPAAYQMTANPVADITLATLYDFVSIGKQGQCYTIENSKVVA